MVNILSMKVEYDWWYPQGCPKWILTWTMGHTTMVNRFVTHRSHHSIIRFGFDIK